MHVQHLGYACAVVVLLLYTRPYTVHSDSTAVSVQYLGTVHLQYRTSVNVITDVCGVQPASDVYTCMMISIDRQSNSTRTRVECVWLPVHIDLNAIEF